MTSSYSRVGQILVYSYEDLTSFTKSVCLVIDTIEDKSYSKIQIKHIAIVLDFQDSYNSWLYAEHKVINILENVEQPFHKTKEWLVISNEC